MIPRIECQGAPRDLGLDQGRAARRLVRAALPGAAPAALRAPRAWWAALARGGAGDPPGRLRRDLERYFPHLAERSEGLACGAGVAPRALLASLALFADAAATGAALALTCAAGAGGERPQALLARALALPERAARSLLLRHSRPESALASVELSLAELAPALAGVNEAGLAAVFAPPPAPLYTEEWMAESAPACAVPALLLLQQCLERFDAVEPAVDWCLRRPAGGAGALLFADAEGRVAGAELHDGARALLRARDGVLPAAVQPAAAQALEKAVREQSAPPAAERLCALAEQASGGGHSVSSLFLDPAGRRLGVRRAGGSPAEPAFEIVSAARRGV